MVDQAQVDAQKEAWAVTKAAGNQEAQPLIKKAWLFAAACWAATLILPAPIGLILGVILGIVAVVFLFRAHIRLLRGGSFRGVFHVIGIVGIGFVVFMISMFLHH